MTQVKVRSGFAMMIPL